MDDQQRPLLPDLMVDRNDRSLEHVWMRHGEVFDLDRGNPLAARLDDVLQPVGELYVTIGINRPDVARAEPAVLVYDLTALALEIARDHPVSAHFQFANRNAVVRQVAPVAPDQLKVDPEHLAPLLGLHVDEFACADACVLGKRRADGRERARLSHPPGLQQDHAEQVAELLDRRPGRRGSARDDLLELQLGKVELRLVRFHPAEEVQPDRRDTKGLGALLALKQRIKAFGVELWTW